MSGVLTAGAALLLIGFLWSVYCALDYRHCAPRIKRQGDTSAREGLILRSREYYALSRDVAAAARWHGWLAALELVLSAMFGWMGWYWHV